MFEGAPIDIDILPPNTGRKTHADNHDDEKNKKNDNNKKKKNENNEK